MSSKINNSHAKIYKLEDKSSMKISVSFTGSWSMGYFYTVSVLTREPRKRNWNKVVSYDSFDYRKLDKDNREDFERLENIRVASIDRINETLLELWEQMKPLGYDGRLK